MAPAPAVLQLVVDEAGEGQRLDNFLLRHLKGVPKSHVYRVIRSGEVRVNKGRAAAETRLAFGDAVRVPPVRRPSMQTPAVGAAVQAREFPVLFEDDDLLAIDKPAGVAVHGGSGLSFGVIEQLRRSRPQARMLELVHRLDRETSGILLVAKRRSTLTQLQDQFRRRETGKTYAALVLGDWPARLHVIDVPLARYLTADGERRVRVAPLADAAAVGRDEGDDGDGRARRAISLVTVVQRYGSYTLLDVTIKTGRTHQIRVHLAQAGHPIVGDDKYGDFAVNRVLARVGVAGGAKFDRMFLHARELAFEHPRRAERLTLRAALPADCAKLLATLQPCAPGASP